VHRDKSHEEKKSKGNSSAGEERRLVLNCVLCGIQSSKY
jgi:hypothetical protein